VAEREDLSRETQEALESGNGPKIGRFALACIGGAVPFAGGIAREPGQKANRNITTGSSQVGSSSKRTEEQGKRAYQEEERSYPNSRAQPPRSGDCA